MPLPYLEYLTKTDISFCAVRTNIWLSEKFCTEPLDESLHLGYNVHSVIYGSRMFNTRFVVSFLLFYTKLVFILFALRAGTWSRHFFILLARWEDSSKGVPHAPVDCAPHPSLCRQRSFAAADAKNFTKPIPFFSKPCYNIGIYHF